MDTVKESDYQRKLDYEARRHYKEKLRIEDEELRDPYFLAEVQLLNELKL